MAKVSAAQTAARNKAAKKMKEAAKMYNTKGNKKSMQECVKAVWKKK